MEPALGTGPVVYGRYQLLELLARGGMAEVFKAKSHGVEGFEKVVVIKRILPELGENPAFVEMFINEAKIAVTLSHANVVQVFDLGRADETYFIAMEFVAGMDLATLLRRSRRVGIPLPQELAVFVVSEVAKGLDYAHRRKDGAMRPLHIVHRDVSPQNVLLSWEGEVKLTDFGIAKARTTVESETESGVLKGKYAYMAPEQAHGREVDGRTDIFALGTVLYEALTGQNPFAAASTYDTLKRVRAGDARPLREVAPEVPDELVAIVQHAMAPAPEARPANASRLYEDLLQFLYASGRRVGAHDLADHLSAVRQASESAQEGGPGGDELLRAAFEEDGGSSAAARAPSATPVEVPSGRTGLRSRGGITATGAQRMPSPSSVSVSRPIAERRDVTALAVSHESGEVAARTALDRLVSRYGGELVADVGGTPVGPAGGVAVALFGAREPDGRDTDSAARCALRLLRTAGSAPLRIAVHAGRILVDLEGNPIAEERMHELVQTARRLAGATEPGRVTVTATTSKLLRARFDVEPRADGTSVLLGERNFAEAYGKFIGRRDDLRHIGESLALANKGRLRIVALTGEAGSGKSRLLHETLRRLKIGGHDVGAYPAVCAPQDRTVPLSAMGEMLRVVLGVDELDPEATIREKVARSRELGLTSAEQASVGVLLGLPLEEDVGPGEQPLRSAMLKVATRLAVDRLTVFAWDSAESMDEESQSFLDGLLRRAADARIAIVIAYRPGFAHGWADLPGYQEIAIGPLTDDDVARLTGSRLGAEEVPFELLRDVTVKSGGNPLYVEEYLRALADSGAVEVSQGKVVYKRDIAELEVPKSLRGIVASRIARLGGTQRHILQIAAIVGARFTPEVLARVSGENLTAVGSALSVLERRGVVVHFGAGEYGFPNDLIPEVLQDGLTVEARRELHGAVADALEVVYAGRTEEIAERLARHRREAGDKERAIAQLVRAADRLESERAVGGAMTQLVSAIGLATQASTPDHDRLLALYRRVGDLSFRSRRLDEGAAQMNAALELAESLRRDSYVARFSMMRGRLLANANRFDEGRRWLERGRDVAARLGDRELHRDALLGMAEAAAKNGEYVRAATSLEEALAISREMGDVPAQIRCLIPLALARGSAGERESGLAALDEARRLAGESPDRYTEVEIHKMKGLVCYFARDNQGTVESAQRAMDLAKEYGFDYEVAVNSHNIGEAHLRLGDFKRAFTALRYSYEVAREHGYVRLQMINLRVLGFIDATRFGSAEGRERVVQAIDHATQQGYVWDIIEGKFMLALIDHARGAVDDCRRLLGEVMRLSADNGHRRYLDDAETALRALEAGEKNLPLPS